MVSPQLQRSPRRPADHLEESNSTASLFLGGVRRDWMASAGAGMSSPREARPGSISHPKLVNPSPKTAPSKVSQVSREIDRPGPAEPALMSPVTPGANLQHYVSLQVQPNVASKPDPPTAAFPSPVPSPGSHPSPIQSPRPTVPSNVPCPAVAVPSASDKPAAVGAVTAQPRRDENASPRQQAPSQPSPASVRDQSPRQSLPGAAEPSDISRSSAPHIANPGPGPLQGIANGTQAQALQATRGPNWSPSMRPNSHSNPPGHHPIGSPFQQATPTLPLASRQLGLPTSNHWMQWKLRSTGLLNEARACSPQVGGPRALLLVNACACDLDDENKKKTGDLFYLVLHQIFCEMSRDPQRILAGLPVLREKNCQDGLARLAELLEDNSKLPAPLLEAFCVFPVRLEDWVNAPWYKVILEEVVGFLSCLVTQFSYMKTETYRRIYERRHPPLVKELRQEYGVNSPILLGVIFMSICRHVYEPQKIDLLQRLFQKDSFLVQKDMPPDAFLPLVEEYRRIPMKPSTPVAPPRSPVSIPQNQRLPQPQGVASVEHPRSAVPSPVINSLAATSPALSANGQHHPTYLSPHIQFPGMPNVPQNIQQAQYVDQYGRRIPPQQAWQMTQMPNAQLAQGQGHPAQPVLLQPVDSAQGQGQNTQMGPVYMVAADQTPPVLVPISPVPSQLNPSASPSQYSVPGWPNHVVQPQSLQQIQQQQIQQQHQHQQQAQPPRSLSTGDPSMQLSATCQAIQTPVINRTSHSTARQSPSVRPVSASVVQVPQTQTTRPRAPAVSPLLPPEGYRAPQTVQPCPMRLGLHQADLRDPVKQLVRLTPGGLFEETALYQYLGGFLVGPTRIDPDVFSYRWKFAISAEDYERFPRYADGKHGHRSIRMYQPGCRTYRLRTIALPASQTEQVQTFWPTANTTWPSVLYIFVNNNEMYVRRKVHNGKDLPLDITRHLRKGDNEVNIHLLLGPGECKNFHYALGIETMEISEYNVVLSRTRQAPASETRALIKERLKPTTDDDELAVVTDSLTIPLIDPFMAQVFNTPARSTRCNHIECFDLDTFIMTRQSQSGPAPMNDNWLCPICKADARPQFLVVDNFFVEVREALKRDGCLETAQSIQVGADGKWTVKTINDDASPSSPTRSRLSQPPSSRKRKADSMADGVSESARTKHESTPNVPVQEPTIIEID